MTISDADLKRLWGRAAGRCSYPSCGEELVKYLDPANVPILGEMAHVIAHSADGPRGTKGKERDDSYANLILLCPTHHTLIDTAPAKFPSEMLHEWKAKHETHVTTALAAPIFGSKSDLYTFVRRRLTENTEVHQRFGPDSPIAKSNPLSSAAALWTYRKLAVIIPNNRKIINAFTQNEALVSYNDWKLFVMFREHAETFEQSTYNRMDDDAVPRFPTQFAKILQE
jgi:hypothetical protein